MKLLLTVLPAMCLTILSDAGGTAAGAILFSEAFNYADGELESASGGLWLRHSGEIDGQFITGGALFIDDDGTKDYSRALGDFPPIKHGAVYAAFDLNVSTADPPENASSSAPYFAHFSEEFGGSTAQVVSRLVMNPGSSPGTFQLGIARGGGGTATTTPWGANLPLGINHRVVIAYDLDADISTLWVNPTSAASPQVVNSAGIGLPIIGLNWLAFRIDGTSGRSGDKTIDNLVVATTFAETLTIPGDTTLPGDFDGDGDVDGADFVVWQTNFPGVGGMNAATGDADGDGDVDGADFVIWQTSFPFSPSGGTIPVPEPPAVQWIAFAGLISLHRARRSFKYRDLRFEI